MKPCCALLFLTVAAAPCLAQVANPVVIIDTNHGLIKVELFADKAPLTVKNFLQYADDRYYDSTIFHRVIPSFMIQGGGHESTLKEKKTRAPVKFEDNGLRHVRGAIAVARAVDPNSGTSQFFINVVNLPHLDQIKPGYTVFGKVVSGMDVVDKIKVVRTGNRGTLSDVPVEDVVVRSVRRASHFVLDLGGGAFEPRRVFTISAYIEHPVPGQYLTLDLPAGLERIEGKEIQPVAIPTDSYVSLVVWRVRGLESGEFECQIRSSTGRVESKKVKITSPRPG